MLKCTARCPLVMTSCKERDTTFITYIQIERRANTKSSRENGLRIVDSIGRNYCRTGANGVITIRVAVGPTKKMMPRRVYFSRNLFLSLSLLPGPFHVVHSQNAPHTSMRVCHGVMYLPSRRYFFLPAVLLF